MLTKHREELDKLKRGNSVNRREGVIREQKARIDQMLEDKATLIQEKRELEDNIVSLHDRLTQFYCDAERVRE